MIFNSIYIPFFLFYLSCCIINKYQKYHRHHPQFLLCLSCFSFLFYSLISLHSTAHFWISQFIPVPSSSSLEAHLLRLLAAYAPSDNYLYLIFVNLSKTAIHLSETLRENLIPPTSKSRIKTSDMVLTIHSDLDKDDIQKKLDTAIERKCWILITTPIIFSKGKLFLDFFIIIIFYLFENEFFRNSHSFLFSLLYNIIIKFIYWIFPLFYYIEHYSSLSPSHIVNYQLPSWNKSLSHLDEYISRTQFDFKVDNHNHNHNRNNNSIVKYTSFVQIQQSPPPLSTPQSDASDYFSDIKCIQDYIKEGIVTETEVSTWFKESGMIYPWWNLQI